MSENANNPPAANGPVIPLNPNAAPSPIVQNMPHRLFKGQAELDDGKIVNIEVHALDHIAAMIKVAAVFSDVPQSVRAWWVKEEGGRIISPFAR